MKGLFIKWSSMYTYVYVLKNNIVQVFINA